MLQFSLFQKLEKKRRNIIARCYNNTCGSMFSRVLYSLSRSPMALIGRDVASRFPKLSRNCSFVPIPYLALVFKNARVVFATCINVTRRESKCASFYASRRATDMFSAAPNVKLRLRARSLGMVSGDSNFFVYDFSPSLAICACSVIIRLLSTAKPCLGANPAL